MKKIVSFLLFTLLAVVVTSCKDNDVTYIATEPLKVLQADVEYSAEGGDGTITVSAESVQAKTESEWVKLSVSGNKVNVSVDENEAFDGRSAKISLVSGSQKADVTVTQKGIIYGINGNLVQQMNNDAGTITLKVLHSSPVTVETSDDWIDARFDTETDNIIINYTKNETGWKRIGTVTVKSGSQVDNIVITQFDLMASLLGDYMLVFNNKTATGDQKVLPAVLTENSLEVQFSSSATFTFPVVIDTANGTVTVGPSGSYLGKYNSYFCYLMFGSASGYWTAYKTTYYSDANIDIIEEGNEATIQMEFGGTFGSYSIDYWNVQR